MSTSLLGCRMALKVKAAETAADDTGNACNYGMRTGAACVGLLTGWLCA
jgi:hypothetical protein